MDTEHTGTPSDERAVDSPTSLPSDQGETSSPGWEEEAEGDAPEEVENDAIAELNRIHAAQSLSLSDESSGYDASYGMSAPPVQTPASPTAAYDPFLAPVRQPADEPAMPSARELKTLEDLYSSYPKIGDGSTHVRVVRKSPRNWGGSQIAGFLGDLNHQISMGDFAAKFGGGVYEVSVRGPGRSTSLDNSGQVKVRTLTTIRIELPGQPQLVVPGNNGGGEGQMMSNGFFRESPQVKLREMELEAEEKRRSEQREERLRSQNVGGVSPEMMQLMEAAATRRSDETRSASDQIIQTLRTQNNRMSEALQARDEKISETRERLLQVQSEYAQRSQQEETRQISELKERHEGDLRRMKENHADTIVRMQGEHQKVLSELTDRSQRERETLSRNEQHERERLREDAGRREKQLQDDFARRETSFREREQGVKDDLNRREEMLRRDYDMRFQALERSQKRDLDIIKSSESTKAELATRTAEMQTNLHVQRIDQLQSEVMQERTMRSTAEQDLNSHVNKPLMQQIEESHRIAEMTGFAKGGGGDEEDGPFDWKRGAVQIAGKLFEQLPEVAKGVTHAREENRVAVARAQQQARIAQSRAQQAQRHHRPSAPQMSASPSPQAPEPQERRVAAPQPPPGMSAQPPTWDAPSGPPDPGDPGAVMPQAWSGPPPVEPKEPEAHHLGSQAPPMQPAPPIAGAAQAPDQGLDFPVEPELVPFGEQEEDSVSQDPAPVQAPSPAPSQEIDPEVLAKVQPEHIARFSSELDTAIAGGLITPKQFAEGFISEVGPDTVAAIVQVIDPNNLIDAIEEQKGGSSTAIATREGRKFVQELWVEIRQILGL